MPRDATLWLLARPSGRTQAVLAEVRTAQGVPASVVVQRPLPAAGGAAAFGRWGAIECSPLSKLPQAQVAPTHAQPLKGTLQPVAGSFPSSPCRPGPLPAQP